MGNALEFILKLTDMLSPGMRQAAAISDSAAVKIQSEFDKINKGGRQMGASVNELRARLDAVNKVRFGTTIEREFNIATRAARKLEDQIDRLENKGKTGGGLLGGLGGLVPGLGLATGIGSAITASSSAETSKMNYSTLLGSKDKGAAMFTELTNYGNQTALQNQDVYNSANTLLSFGVAGDKVMPIIKMLGDVSLGNSDKFNSLSLAFAQTTSAGRLMGQDLLQYVNAGFNPLNEISKMTGESMASLKDKMEKGAITAEMVNAAFMHATATGGMFHNALANAADTTAGKWGSFMGSVQTRLIQIGDFLKPVTNGVIDFGSALLNGEPAAIALAIAIGGLALAIWGGSAATGAWSAAMAIWNTIAKANPIILIISLVIALGIWIYSLTKKYEGWSASMKGLWEVIKGFVNLNLIAWKNFGENIVYWVQYAFLKVKNFVEWVGGAMNNVWNALTLAAQFKFSEARVALSAEIKTTASQELAALEAKHNAGQLANQQSAMQAVKQMQTGMSMIGLKKIADTGRAGVVDPTTENAAAGQKTNFSSLTTDSEKSKAESINSGGQRSIIINIAKQVGVEEIHVMGAGEIVSEIESAVREAMRRMVYSLNGVAPN